MLEVLDGLRSSVYISTCPENFEKGFKFLICFVIEVVNFKSLISDRA